MLAIVIPYYKRTFFEETLQSLVKQTDKRFHVYIGDDASPEPMADLLERYKDQFEYTFKRFEANFGGTSLVKQWERCIEMVQEEEWLMILGDDDVLGENVVEAFYENIEEVISNSINVIRYSTIVINELSQEISDKHTHPLVQNSLDFMLSKIEGKSRSSLSEYVFNKKVLLKTKIHEFPDALYSDDLLIIEVSDYKNIFSIEELIYIRKSNFNLSGVNGNFDKKEKAKKLFFYHLLRNKVFFYDSNYLKRFIKLLSKQIIKKKNFSLYIFTIIQLIKKFRLKIVLKLNCNILENLINKVKTKIKWNLKLY